VEFEQRFAYDLTGLIAPYINDVTIDVLNFAQGVYRITLSTEDVTLDSRADPFFFWNSNDGIFESIIEYCENIVSFIFRANPNTANRNARIVIGIGDNLGQTDRVAIYLKGNDLEIMPQGFAQEAIIGFMQEDVFDEILHLPIPNIDFDPDEPFNISFAIDTSLYNLQEIIEILVDSIHFVSSDAYFSVVSNHNTLMLSDAATASNHLQSLRPSTFTEPIDILNASVSTLAGGQRQNVIIMPVDTWNLELIQRVQNLEEMGFIVHLLDAANLQEQLDTLCLFSNRFLAFSAMIAASSDIVFPDVPPDHWAAIAIYDLARRGSITGRANGTFGTNDYATVAEFLAMAMRLAYGWPPNALTAYVIHSTGEKGFITESISPNLNPPTYYNREHIVHVLANRPITREYAFFLLDMIFSGQGSPDVVIGNRLSNLNSANVPTLNLTHFFDFESISVRYRSSVATLRHSNIVRGELHANQLVWLDPPTRMDVMKAHPNRNITRAEAANILFRTVTPHSIATGERVLDVDSIIRSFVVAEENVLFYEEVDNIHGESRFIFTAPASGFYTFKAYREFVPRVFLVDKTKSPVETTYLHQTPSLSSGFVQYKYVTHFLEAGQEVVVSLIRWGGGRAELAVERTSSARIVWPVPTHHHTNSPFGYRYAPALGLNNYHRGIDTNGPQGTYIHAIMGGYVDQVIFSDRGYGNTVIIQHDNGFRTFYAHLDIPERGGILVAVRQRVEAGDIIGRMGTTGDSFGNHLHLNFYSPSGIRLNPLPFYHPTSNRSNWRSTHVSEWDIFENPNPLFIPANGTFTRSEAPNSALFTATDGFIFNPNFCWDEAYSRPAYTRW
jgi:murein DD-endopeptidase MepM/ murein hydrolase activator NlpD